MKKDTLVVHCLDTYRRMDVSVDDVTGWHKERGFTTIGYAHLIKFDGSIHKGRDLDGDGDVADEQGAHAQGYNRRSIGIALEGGKGDDNLPEDNFTEAQFASLKFLVDEYETRFPGIKTVGHNNLSGVTKPCPCFDVIAWRKTW